MIFRKITLNNLGPFREQHSINVSVEDKNKFSFDWWIEWSR